MPLVTERVRLSRLVAAETKAERDKVPWLSLHRHRVDPPLPLAVDERGS